MKPISTLLALLLSTQAALHADDSAKIASIFSTAAERHGVITIPPGDYDLDGKMPFRIASRMTVSAYGARFHLPKQLGDKARVVLFSGENVSDFRWLGGHFIGHVFDNTKIDNAWEPNANTRAILITTTAGGRTENLTFRDITSDGLAGAAITVRGAEQPKSDRAVETFARNVTVENCTLERSGKFMWDYGLLWQITVWPEDYNEAERAMAAKYFRNDLIRGPVRMETGNDRVFFDNAKPLPLTKTDHGGREAICFFGDVLPTNIARGKQYFIIESTPQFIRIAEKPGGAAIRFAGSAGPQARLISDLFSAHLALYAPSGAGPGKGALDLVACSNVVVRGCTLSALGDTMHIQKSRDILFANNRITGSRMGAFFLAEYCKNAVIVSNTVNGSNGSRVMSIEKSAENVTIMGNTFCNGGRGSWINQPRNLLMQGNVFSNNTTKCERDPHRGRRTFVTGDYERYAEMYFTTYESGGRYGDVILRENIFTTGPEAANAITFAPGGDTLLLERNTFRGPVRSIPSATGCTNVTFRDNVGTKLSVAKADMSDVVVYGATPGGVAAAVSAARSGASVVLIEESDHVGGIVAGGLSNSDIRNRDAVGGLFKEFVRRICDYYVTYYGAESPQVNKCQGGYWFEPKVAERVFNEMLAGENNIRLLLNHRIVSARVMRDGHERDAEPGKRMDGAMPKEFGAAVKLVAVLAEDLSKPSTKTEFRAKTFIDCTYEGDLAAIAGVPYRVGREGRDAFGEPHAGRIYAKFGTRDPLPGSTGEADNGIQAFCFRFHMTKNATNSVPVEKPATFYREDYRALLDDIRAGRISRLTQAIQFYPMPNGKFEINSDHPHPDAGVPSESLDLAEENWGWPEAGPEERARIFARYWTYNEGLVWLLQHDAEVPAAIRTEAKLWGFPKDEFTDHRNRPHALYVRQGRRIWGEYNFTQRDADPDEKTGHPRPKADSIAVAEFEFDSHAVHKFDPSHPGVREGYIFIAHEPLDLPYRILVPKCVDGLLVPVACSATHVGYQTIRMEPVFMALGEAAGVAAKVAHGSGSEVRALPMDELRTELLRRNAVLHLAGTH